jgi:SAM-dependent methyltransferase
LKRILKKVLPSFVTTYLGKHIIAYRSATLSRLPPGEAFDRIYRKKYWRQGASLSGLGSEGQWAEDYASFVIDYISKTGARRVVDAGCGDFLVGSLIAPHCQEIIALDISNEIITQNRSRFEKFTNVEFRVANLIEERVPDCDLILVRQVLQHLSNAQIERVLKNIDTASAPHVLITEHSVKADMRSDANIDLGSHSVATRVAHNSGVDIGLAPFSRPRRIVAEIEPSPENSAEPNSILYIYELSRG